MNRRRFDLADRLRWRLRRILRPSLWLARGAYWVTDFWRERLWRRQRYADYRPPLTATGGIDWSALEDYGAVAKALGYRPPRTSRELLCGGVARYFELCETTQNRAGAARTMEFARHAIGAFKKRRVWLPSTRRRLDAQIAAELERRFGATRPWLIEVYEGKRNHHSV